MSLAATYGGSWRPVPSPLRSPFSAHPTPRPLSEQPTPSHLSRQPTPRSQGFLRRPEFIAACEALLADTPGHAGANDLHDLFDLLDPQCTGTVSLQEFSRLIRTQRPDAGPEEVRRVLGLGFGGGAEGLGPVGGGSMALSPLEGIRAWMQQHGWLLQDLADVFRDEHGRMRQQLAWPEFRKLILGCLHAPWLTQQGAEEIFIQFSVKAVGRSQNPLSDGVVHVADLLEALVDSPDFVEEAGARCIRAVFRLAHYGDVDMKKKCIEKDGKRTGVLDYKQVAALVN